MVYMKTEGIYVDITKDVETRFYIANYKLEKTFSKGKSKIVTRSMKDDLRIIWQIFLHWDKIHITIYQIAIVKVKKRKGTKKYTIKQKLKFEDCNIFYKQSNLKMKQPNKKK